MSNPAAPINFVEEPVHDDEQHDHGQQSGRRLKIERRDVIAQRTDDADRDEPRNQCCAETDSCADRHRPPMRLFRSRHARRDRRQNENAFQSFAENQHADIEERDRRAGVGPQWIGRPLFRHALPD